jgi:hypothetical protein
MARYPGKPSAKDIPDVVLLRVVEDFHAARGPFPFDAFPSVPSKTIVAKQRKLVQRGLLTRDWKLTEAGVNALKEAEW